MKDLDDTTIDPWLYNFENFDPLDDDNNNNSIFPTGNLNELMNPLHGLFNFNQFNNININKLIPPTDIIPNLNGIYNYRLPTDRQFAYCQKVNGISIWDKNGWWKCLFPNDHIIKILNSKQQFQNNENKSISLDDLVTKEKVNLKEYFTDYTHYLLWKLKNERDQNNRLSHADDDGNNKFNKWGQDSLTTGNEIGIKDDNDVLLDEDKSIKKIIGREQSISMKNSNDKTVANEEIKITKIFYDDGSILVKKATKTTPKDGSEPIINETETWDKNQTDPKYKWL